MTEYHMFLALVTVFLGSFSTATMFRAAWTSRDNIMAAGAWMILSSFAGGGALVCFLFGGLGVFL